MLACPLCGARPPLAKPGARCDVDQSVLLTPTALRLWGEDPFIGRVVAGRYTIFDLLGRGGFGAVYRAIQAPLGREVALKTIRPDASGGGVDPKARFFQEAKILAQLTHPGIVRVFDYGEDQSGLFMVLEMIRGAPLSDLLRDGPLPYARVVDLGAQILSALAEPHEHALVHRDLKPDNILVVEGREGSQARLIDFGIAKALVSHEDDPHTRTGIAIGTVRYMAPEQLRQRGLIGPWTDQYSVGVILYRMVAGVTPFDGSTAEMAVGHLEKSPPPFSLGLDIPDALSYVIFKALSKRPEARFKDVSAMRAALLDVLAAPPPRPAQLGFEGVAPICGPSAHIPKAEVRPPHGVTPLALFLALVFLGGLAGLVYWLESAPLPAPQQGHTLSSPRSGAPQGVPYPLKAAPTSAPSPPPGLDLPNGVRLMSPEALWRLAEANQAAANDNAPPPSPEPGSIYKSLTFSKGGADAGAPPEPDSIYKSLMLKAEGLAVEPTPRLDALRAPLNANTPRPPPVTRMLQAGQERQEIKLRRALERRQCGIARALLEEMGPRRLLFQAEVEACRPQQP